MEKQTLLIDNDVPKLELQDDSDLIRETLQGNTEAFGQLIRKHQPRFSRLALSILKNEEEAEDAVQDAFMEAYRALPKFQFRSQFSTWLYTIVINHVRNRLRHKKTLCWMPLETNLNKDGVYQPLEIPEKDLPLETMLEQKFEVERLQTAVETLPLHYRSIFIMHYFEGRQVQDIAATLHTPLGTVKSYLHRGRKMVTDILEK